jgi:hypothetical protein
MSTDQTQPTQTQPTAYTPAPVTEEQLHRGITVYLLMRQYPNDAPEFAGMVFISEDRAKGEVAAMMSIRAKRMYIATYFYQAFTAT